MEGSFYKQNTNIACDIASGFTDIYAPPNISCDRLQKPATLFRITNIK